MNCSSVRKRWYTDQEGMSVVLHSAEAAEDVRELSEFLHIQRSIDQRSFGEIKDHGDGEFGRDFGTKLEVLEVRMDVQNVVHMGPLKNT